MYLCRYISFGLWGITLFAYTVHYIHYSLHTLLLPIPPYPSLSLSTPPLYKDLGGDPVPDSTVPTDATLEMDNSMICMTSTNTGPRLRDGWYVSTLGLLRLLKLGFFSD